jgi:hypothetical protein
MVEVEVVAARLADELDPEPELLLRPVEHLVDVVDRARSG